MNVLVCRQFWRMLSCMIVLYSVLVSLRPAPELSRLLAILCFCLSHLLCRIADLLDSSDITRLQGKSAKARCLRNV